MTTTQDLSILAMISSASLVVQLVLILLIVVSFMSWYFIFLKLFTIHRAQSRTEQFERDFWSGTDLPALFQSAVNHRHSTGSLERIFAAIPAVVAYNRFSHNVDRLAVRFESFMEEFSNILQRQAQARLASAHETART